ncbi:MAG: NADP-dependent isocitrate dehydrogenase, partial [Longimicrobiales bacterium]
MSVSPPIIYTWTDEAPALATHALLPVIRAFAGAAGVPIETRDISLAGRVLAAFPDFLNDDQRVPDDLAELGRIVERPQANIIKLPNVSASLPQLKACIAELSTKGYALPDYPDEPTTDRARDIRSRYDRVKGSAMNPVLRQGNSDRRAPGAVKEFARSNPPRMMPWPDKSRTHVSTMSTGDFRGNEKSVTLDSETTVRIEHIAADGTATLLKEGLTLEAGEVFDTTIMSTRRLVDFLRDQVRDAKEQGVLFSLHLKATMMKVSDPIMFGHCVRVFFADVFTKHAAVLAELGANPNNGLGDVLAKVSQLPEQQRAAIDADIRAAYQNGPALAMVDSARGITN